MEVAGGFDVFHISQHHETLGQQLPQGSKRRSALATGIITVHLESHFDSALVPGIIVAGVTVMAAGLGLASSTVMECRQSWDSGLHQAPRSVLNVFSILEASCLCWACLEAQKLY